MGFFDRFKKRKEPEEYQSLPHETEEPKDASSDGSFDSSISISLSKASGLEETAFPDESEPGNTSFPTSISNERIMKGDSVLDTYEVVSDAIKGGMGSVWKVHHRNWNVELAMKRPQPKFFAEGSEKRKENFVHECEAWINLGLHPNIVSCYYVREIGGVPTIFSEWMENGSLKNRIDDGSLYELSDGQEVPSGEKEQVIQARLLDIAIQFARGLHYAHESKDHLIHQDVKPDNLLLTKEWDAKVADFGLARARTELTSESDGASFSGSAQTDEVEPGATHIAPTGGYTPAYCSSEQYLGEPLTRRTDIYSWALSVLEMYKGSRPWIHGIDAGKNCRLYFSECRVVIPDPLRKLLLSCLSERAEDRPHDFGIVIEKLCEIYKWQTSEKYSRPQYIDVTESAESLNNRALSFLDLKRYSDAEMCWKKAVENNSRHVESIYNELIYRWNKAEIDDIEVLKRIRNADDGSAEAMLCQLRIQIARADTDAYNCIDILKKDRDIRTGSTAEKELEYLTSICEKICRTDELVCEAPEGLLIADEKGNLGCCITEKDNNSLIFRDLSGNITEQYEGRGEIKEVLFDSSCRRIAVFCDSDVLIFDRGYGPVLSGDEAVRTVDEWRESMSCGLHGSPIVVYDPENETNEISLLRNPGITPLHTDYRGRFIYSELIYSKADHWHLSTFSSGDVRYILKPHGQVLKTLRMRTENKKDEALNLNPLLYLDSEKKHVRKRAIPDLRYRPQMILSKIVSYEESLKNDREFSELMQAAAEARFGGDLENSIRYIDKAMNVTGHFNDDLALETRRQIMKSLENRFFDRVLVVNRHQPGTHDKWYEIPAGEANQIINMVLSLDGTGIGHDPRNTQKGEFSIMYRVIPTQFPDVYIVTGRGINTFEHPRYGDDIIQSRSWTAVVDVKQKSIMKAAGPDHLGRAETLAGDTHTDNLFRTDERIAAAVSNDGAGLIVSCGENKLFSDSLCLPKDYAGPRLDYIFPMIANDYYLFIGRDYTALAYISKGEGEIIWEYYSKYSDFTGFDREASSFSVVTDDKEKIIREILWNFERPTLRSRIAKWDSLDYFGPVRHRSQYF